jgi:hypothetical protein
MISNCEGEVVSSAEEAGSSSVAIDLAGDESLDCWSVNALGERRAARAAVSLDRVSMLVL